MRGERVGPPADVYALGCVLFAALTGQAPFQRAGALATAWAHVHDPVPDLGAEVPPQLRELVARALRKSPQDRPDAGELAREVAALAGPGGGASAAARVVARAGAVSEEAPTAAPSPAATTPAQGFRPAPAGEARTARLASDGSGGPRQGRGALLAMAGVLLSVAAVVVVLTPLGGGGDREQRAEPQGPQAPAAADANGDTVSCDGGACHQGGERVAAPVEGARCGTGAWVRLDADGGTPLLACEPGEGAAATPPEHALSLNGAQLDLAETLLDRRGVEHEATGGGALGIIARSNWTVCATAPEAGEPVPASAPVTLFVERSC